MTRSSPGAARRSSPDGPTRILDVRTAGEWVGTDLRAKRGGHIPGARQRCFVDLLTDEGTFRPVDEMLSLVARIGAEPAEVRATYCQGGVRAALVWFVLHELAGFDDVRSYAGSWEEWGNRPGQPDRARLGHLRLRRQRRAVANRPRRRPAPRHRRTPAGRRRTSRG